MTNRHFFSELDRYHFGRATHYELYEKLGAHLTEEEGAEGCRFAVWAPNARRVCVVGDFNQWNEEEGLLEGPDEIGIWQRFISGAKAGDHYKYRLVNYAGKTVDKADPFAFWAELRPGTASRIADLRDMKWGDGAWMKARAGWDCDTAAVSVYECHIASFMRHPVADEAHPDAFYTYREFAEKAAAYVKEMGYTHIELIGIAEHPFDGSWGYQVTGYFAPTARYGTPEDFRWMIDYFHRNGIGVILDWVPAHFPKDEAGLAEFDGTALFEHEDPRQGEHPDWGTKIFNCGRPEVKNFLLASALYWIEFFHVDGLRVDAVASMLYLDYGKKDGGWVANKYGGNQNLEAIEFFKHLNSLVLGRNPGTMMIAEESTAWPKVTGNVAEDGLGFSLKWNMGWMNDFLEYMKLDPYFRKNNHNKMTFAMTYAYSEKYVLVLSHDEVVHLKGSMWTKMPGIFEDKYSNLKAGYTFMIGHPGKKLLFMGQDFAQAREWSEARELDWHLLGEQPLNRQLQAYVAELLRLYRKYPALYATDRDSDAFCWVNADDAERSIFSFYRRSPDGKDNLLFVLNMTPVARPDYRCGVPAKTACRLLLNSMDPAFGGTEARRKKTYQAAAGECDGLPWHIAYDLPAYGAAVFCFDL